MDHFTQGGALLSFQVNVSKYVRWLKDFPWIKIKTKYGTGCRVTPGQIASSIPQRKPDANSQRSERMSSCVKWLTHKSRTMVTLNIGQLFKCSGWKILKVIVFVFFSSSFNEATNSSGYLHKRSSFDGTPSELILIQQRWEKSILQNKNPLVFWKRLLFGYFPKGNGLTLATLHGAPFVK